MIACQFLALDSSDEGPCLLMQATGGLGLQVELFTDIKSIETEIDSNLPDILFFRDLPNAATQDRLLNLIYDRLASSETVVLAGVQGADRRKHLFERGVDLAVQLPYCPVELRAVIESAVKQVGFTRLLHQQTELQQAFISLSQTNAVIMEGWSRALDLRDNETEGHSLRVTELTVRLATRLGFQEPELTDIRYGALLHDVGKIGIPDRILHKQGTLTDAERAEMQRHPEYAYAMLQGLQHLPHTIAIPYSHHERWDGSGYPLGISGIDIPFSARIFSVVDVYDALKTERPYKGAWSDEEAFSELLANSGTHFDPQVVKEFIAMMRETMKTAA